MKIIKEKNAQSAMEFLMTYGWGILVVLAAIGALAYFGVLSPERFIPAKCVFPAGIYCADFNLKEDGITIVLMNSLGRDMTLKNISIGDCMSEVDSTLINGMQKTFELNCANPPGKIKENIRLIYVDETSGIVKSFNGEIQGEVI